MQSLVCRGLNHLPGSIGAGQFPSGADGLLCVEERLRGRLLGRHVAVGHHRLEVANLAVDVEAEAWPRKNDKFYVPNA